MYLYQVKEEIARIEKLRSDMVLTNIEKIEVDSTFWGVYFDGIDDGRVGKLEDEIQGLEDELKTANGYIGDLEYGNKKDKEGFNDEIDTLSKDLGAAETKIVDLQNVIRKLETELKKYKQ